MPRKCLLWQQRFWPKVDKQQNGCWLWMGARKDTGHGQFQLNHKTVSAYRFLWEQTNGPIPEGMYLMHLCNQPACVNPSHLRVATPRQNAVHMILSGRHWSQGGNPIPRYRPMKKTTEQRFWDKVERTDACWIWTGVIYQGYGLFNSGVAAGNKTVRAHRYAWELEFGKIPKGLDVLHICDNRSCVRGDHLYLGTDADNVRDTESRNRARHPFGESHGKAKLRASDVLLIRNSAEPRVVIAQRFSVTPQLIGAIRKGKIWKHLI